MTPADVSREALRWLGVPFRWQGRSRHGLDCGGLAEVVGKSLGLLPGAMEPPRYRATLPHGFLLRELRRHFAERAGAIRRSGCGNAAPGCCPECMGSLAGCIVVLGIAGGHCGIVTDDGRLVTVGDAAGCQAIPLTSETIRLVRAVFEFPGVKYP